MKKLLSLIVIALLGNLLLFTSCKDDGGEGPDEEEELTAQQIAAKSLSDGSPWKVSSVDSKPNEEIDDQQLMSLTLDFGVSGSGTDLAPSDFSATGAGDFLNSDASATWSWSGNGTSTIELTNASTNQLTNVTFTPDAENPTSITLTFNVPAGARVSEVDGSYTVTLE